MPSGVNYLSEVLPGDYLCVWMLNEAERAADLAQRIRDGKPCNKFMDGLKFLGKADAVQKSLTQSPDGQRTIRYSLTGNGFSEFDATLFYDQHLAEKFKSIGQYFGRIASSLNQLTVDGMVDVNKAIPFFIDLLYGRGVPPNLGRDGPADPALKSTAGLEGPYSYILPQAVGTLIGKTKSSKDPGVLAYADVLELQTGIQSYALRGTAPNPETDPDEDIDDINRGLTFTPEGPTTGSRRESPYPMMGRFNPTPPQFTNASVWSILSQYLNPACNEMYTVLRTNGQGNVVPTLVVRQLPFSSNLVNVPFQVTKFLDLPRWKIHPILVRTAVIGRSDALRFNFVNVQGLSAIDKVGATAQLVRNPPFRDELDISRSGLRAYQTTIPCAIDEIKVQNSVGSTTTAASNWMDLMADILMGQHLTLTGTLSLVGIQAPICVGDNLEWDGVVFHIESVSHACQINGNGIKSFTTTLALSHGLRVDAGTDDITIYAGIKATDQTQLNPGLTDEGQDNGNVLADPEGTQPINSRRSAALGDAQLRQEAPLDANTIQGIFRSVK